MLPTVKKKNKKNNLENSVRIYINQEKYKIYIPQITD